MNNKTYKSILILIFLLSVFLLSIIKINDTDAWLHLSMGKIIWEKQGMPDNEPYLFTMQDEPFVYSSWLFGVIYYLVYKLFNYNGIILFKAVTITLTFLILLKDSLIGYSKENGINKYFIAIIVLSITVLISRHRFVERPDTFLMLFLSLTIYSLNSFISENKKYIYALPFVHFLWANSHSSINLMLVPFGSFIIIGIIERLFRFKNFGGDYIDLKKLKIIFIIFILSFIASLLSPYSITQYIGSVQFLKTFWFKEFITELRPPTWNTNKAPYILTALFFITFLINLILLFLNKRIGSIEFKRHLVSLILIIPFIYLSFTSIRFIVLLAIVSGPIISKNILEILEGIRSRSKISDFLFKLEQNKKLSGIFLILIILWISFYTYFNINNIKPFNKNKDFIFGFGINYDKTPEKALRYMDIKGITGRIFNSFHLGQYISWRDFPKRSPFIDGRGMNRDLFEKAITARQSSMIMDELVKQYGFEVFLFDYSNIETLRSEIFSDKDALLVSKQWALVYWDDYSLIYLLRGGKYQDIIDKDEYLSLKPANAIANINYLIQNKEYMERVLEELNRNIQTTGSSRAYALLGAIYSRIGLYQKALDTLSKVNDFGDSYYIVLKYDAMGVAYLGMGRYDDAIKYFKKSLFLDKNARTLNKIGIVYNYKGDKKRAIEYLEKTIEMDPNLINARNMLIQLYHEVGRSKDAQKLRQGVLQ